MHESILEERKLEIEVFPGAYDFIAKTSPGHVFKVVQGHLANNVIKISLHGKFNHVFILSVM